jgi:hypothetical protein
MANLYTPVPPEPEPSSPVGKTNTLSIISLITGIVGLIAPCIAFVISLIPVVNIICGLICPLIPVAALVTGFIGNNKIKTSGEKGRGMAIAGIIMGAIGFLVYCLLLFLVIFSYAGILALPFLLPTTN